MLVVAFNFLLTFWNFFIDIIYFLQTKQWFSRDVEFSSRNKIIFNTYAEDKLECNFNKVHCFHQAADQDLDIIGREVEMGALKSHH